MKFESYAYMIANATTEFELNEIREELMDEWELTDEDEELLMNLLDRLMQVVRKWVERDGCV